MQLEEIKGENLVFLFGAEDIFISRERFPKTREDILQLQIREFLQERGLFEGVPKIAYRVAEEEDPQVELEIVAVEERIVNRWLRELLKNKHKLSKLIPEILGVAWLTLKESDQFLLSVYLSEESFWLVLTGNGYISYFRNVHVDPTVGLMEEVIEQGLLATLDYCTRVLGVEIEGIIPYGPKRELLPESSVPFFEPQFSYFEGVDKELILEFPFFFGVFWVPEEFNFLPSEYRLFLTQLTWARKVGFTLLGLSLLNMGLWAYYQPKVKKLQAENKVLSSEIRKIESELQKYLPPEKQAIIQKWFTYLDRYKKTFILPEFLSWVDENLPPNTQFTFLDGEKTSDNKFVLTMTFEAQGSVSEANQKFKFLVKRLAKKIKVAEIDVIYHKKDKKGILKLKGEYDK